MRVMNIQLTNFGSYEEISINPYEHGLTAISGPTGAGKSVLCDALLWLLYGQTLKDCSADGVRRWGTTSTVGKVSVEVYKDCIVSICRSRGERSDLTYSVSYPLTNEHSPPQRGATVSDTQKMLNQVLGVDFDTFVAASYAHELTSVSSFFSSSVKARRDLIRQIADTSFCEKLITKTKEYAKFLKEEQKDNSVRLEMCREKAKYLHESNESRILANIRKEKDHLAWVEKKASKIAELELRKVEAQESAAERLAKLSAETLEWEKQHAIELEELQTEITSAQAEVAEEKILTTHLHRLQNDLIDARSRKCDACGNPIKAEEVNKLLVEISKTNAKIAQMQESRKRMSEIKHKLTKLKDRKNPYEDQLSEDGVLKYIQQSLDAAILSTSPYLDKEPDKDREEREDIDSQVADLQSKVNWAREDIEDCGVLADILGQQEMLSVKGTVQTLVTQANHLLTTHFGTEVKFSITSDDAERPEILIWKNGNACSFGQLSKGQRQLLKLCFSIAVMRQVASRHGFTPPALFFDEMLDGLDEDTKNAAFGLFSELTRTAKTIFVVDHSTSLKSKFENAIIVEMNNDTSRIVEGPR